MREIKFRAWDKTGKVMYSLEDMDNCFYLINGFTGKLHWIGHLDFEEEPMDNFELMQFTGLKDKNGKEIYEGDILNVCNGSINGARWMDEPYAVQFYPGKGFDVPSYCWNEDGKDFMDSTHWCEVMGNIYENTELIKTGAKEAVAQTNNSARAQHGEER